MKSLRSGMLVLGCGVSLAVMGACSRESSTTAETAAPPSPTISNISEKPDSFLGQTVTVKGEIKEIKGTRMMWISPPGREIGKDLLVASKREWPRVEGRPTEAWPAKNDAVEVTGTVQKFDAALLEREVGIKLEPANDIGDWNGKPVLLASRIIVTPGPGSDTGAKAAPDKLEKEGSH